jgi:hypothetical protein
MSSCLVDTRLICSGNMQHMASVVNLCEASIAGETPTIKLGNGQPYREGSLWKDIYQAILNAKHFVYIAGEQRL